MEFGIVGRHKHHTNEIEVTYTEISHGWCDSDSAHMLIHDHDHDHNLNHSQNFSALC